MSQYDPMFDLKINIGDCNLYFMVRWFCLISWRLFDVRTSLFGIMSQYDPKFDLKINIASLWPIFHGPVILHYILKIIWCMNIIHWAFGSVWPDIWPQNKCRSMWPTFHGPVILSYIFKTIWCMRVIFSDNERVWPKLWPQSIYKSTWPIFCGLVILLNIFKIIRWMNIIVGIMDQCTHRLTVSSICTSVTYILWSSVFASYLEDYLMEKCCTWDNVSVWLKDRPCNICGSVTYISWSIYFALHHCHRLKLF